MNSIVLMAKVVRRPELRYTPDNQLPIAQMLVEFPGLRPEDAPSTLKVTGFGNLAQDIEQHYGEGDRIIISGRLQMNTIDRQEGFKEKRGELILSQILRLDEQGNVTATAVAAASKETPRTPTSSPEAIAAPEKQEQNLDEIPF
ncbi:MAG: single-stranded DNA-binding protein [Chloroflexaceae bacterium]|nr:single-stranded DNA-binding protein [Chloroflexaceae bacterium]